MPTPTSGEIAEGFATGAIPRLNRWIVNGVRLRNRSFQHEIASLTQSALEAQAQAQSIRCHFAKNDSPRPESLLTPL